MWVVKIGEYLHTVAYYLLGILVCGFTNLLEQVLFLCFANILQPYYLETCIFYNFQGYCSKKKKKKKSRKRYKVP